MPLEGMAHSCDGVQSMMPERRVRPRWQLVEVAPDKRTPRIKIDFEPVGNGLVDKNGNLVCKMVQTVVDADERQFDVYMPKGNSVRLRESELRAMGLDRKPELIDLSTGEILPTMGHQLLEPLEAPL